jgi:sugar lactone lactonase YvrE
MYRLSVLFSALMLGVQLHAQDPFLVVPRQYGAAHGMSNRHVTALHQDGLGYIWVGTVSGLDRFDGHSFRNWSAADGLSAGEVDELRSDADGRLWVFAEDGEGDITAVDVLAPDAQRLEPVTDLPVDPEQLIRVGPQRSDGVLVMGLRSPARCLWRLADGSYRTQVLDGERFEPLGDDGSGAVIGLLVDSTLDRRLVTVTLDGTVQVFKELTKDTHVEIMISGRRTRGALYRIRDEDQECTYYDTYSALSAELGLNEVLPNGDPVRRTPNYTPLPNGMHVVDTRIHDKDGRVVFDLSTHFPEVGGRVKDCMVDRSGDPWMATEFGLFHVDLRGDLFERWLDRDTLLNGLGLICRGMVWHAGELLLVTEWEGAYRISTQGAPMVLETLSSPLYLFANHMAPDGTWWRGGPSEVVARSAQGKERRYMVPDKIWSIHSLSNGRLVLGGTKGLHLLDPTTGSCSIWNDPDHPELNKAIVLQIQDRGNDGLLATTSKGLYRLGRNGRVLRRWHTQGEGGDRIPFSDLHHCMVDEDGVFWLATRGSGLLRLDPRSDEHRLYTKRSGFPNNMVYAVYGDAFGQLWLSTDGGIVRFDKASGQSTVFTTADGISNDEFNRVAHAQSPDGRLYFGGLNGITVFDPARFHHPERGQAHPLLITGLSSYSARTNDWHTWPTTRTVEEGLRMTDADGSLEIGFALLSFDGQGRNLYAWRLREEQEDWNYQHDPKVRLDRLPYGTHTFEVRARDAMGVWSDRVVQLSITVDGPWHASKAAVMACGAGGMVLLMAAVLLVLRIRSGRRRRLRRAVVE